MSTSSDSDATDCLYGAWMEHRSPETNKWSPVWCVLKSDSTLFFFTSEKTCLETHIGTLKLDRECSFHYGPGDSREGYRFDLYIAKKKKKFKVKTQYDREVWRAYMEGVTMGRVPQNVTLSPQDMLTISSKFQGPQSSPSTHPQPSPSAPFTRASQPPQRPPASQVRFRDFAEQDGSSDSSGQLMGERRPSMPSLGSTGTDSSGDGGFDPPGRRGLVEFYLREPSQGSKDSGVSNSTGGPFMHHKFDKEPPSWFFEDCSRELSEKILQQCSRMGNTMMRVSTSARQTGSYVISKRTNESMGKPVIYHYEVIRVAEGYTIDVSNCKQTMTTLSEVMDYFIQLSGTATTRLMASNDLKELGIEYDAYHRHIVVHEEPQAPIEPLDEPEEGDNYEVPQQPQAAAPPPPPPVPVPPSTTFPKAAYKTWSKPGGTRQPTGQQEGGAAKTVGPSDRRQVKADSSKPSAMQVHQNMEEQDVVANLDTVIRNEETKFTRKAKPGSNQAPPLPAVPKDRPKLCSSAARGDYYVSASSGPPADTEEETSAVHPRWNRRCKSVSVLCLDTNVPARVAPPSVIKPTERAEEREASGGGGGRKIPPPTVPKSGHFPIKVPATDSLKAMQQELEQILQKRASQMDEAKIADSAGGSESSAPTGRPGEGEAEENYEDISHYYQNVPSS